MGAYEMMSCVMGISDEDIVQVDDAPPDPNMDTDAMIEEVSTFDMSVLPNHIKRVSGMLSLSGRAAMDSRCRTALPLHNSVLLAADIGCCRLVACML